MATAESPTCACAPGERSPPTALATWVFSSSAGWPTGTVSGCGCAVCRPSKHALARRPRSICQRRCWWVPRTATLRRPKQRWQSQTSRRRPITRRPRITAKLRSLLRWRKRPSATARIRPNRRSACCRGAGPDPAASPVPQPTSRVGRHGVRHPCAGEKRQPSRLLKSLKPLRLNRFQARRRSSAHGCGSLASRLPKPSRSRRSPWRRSRQLRPSRKGPMRPGPPKPRNVERAAGVGSHLPADAFRIPG